MGIYRHCSVSITAVQLWLMLISCLFTALSNEQYLVYFFVAIHLPLSFVVFFFNQSCHFRAVSVFLIIFA